MNRIPAAFLAAAGLSLGLATASSGEETLRETLEVRPGGRLLVELERGDVEIVSHEADAVRIDAVARGFNSLFYDFELETDEDEVRLTGELGFWHSGIFPDPDVVVRVWVPREYSLDLRTARGSVAVSQVEGDVEVASSRGSIDLDHVRGRASLHTSRGEIRIRSLNGDLEASTSRGTIEIDDVSGSVEVETSRGRIDVADVGGDLRVRTSRGPIEIRDAQGEIDAQTSRGPISLHAVLGRVLARTSRGEIFVSFTGEPAGELRSSRGAIRVVIPESAGVDLDAETTRGRIDIGDKIEVRGDHTRERVVAQLNGGGERLRLRTSRNEIQIRNE